MIRLSHMMRSLVLTAALPILGGCVAFHVDSNQAVVQASEFRKPAKPPDIQLIWEFQTKGVPNAQATGYLQDRVREQIASSGLFGKVSEAPVPSGALLTATIDNVPLTDDAARRGFVAGLTFGLAGTAVGDGYDCTLRYTPAREGNATPLVHTGKHILYTSVGSGRPPDGARKMPGADQAVTTMLQEILGRTLLALSLDPAFP